MARHKRVVIIRGLPGTGKTTIAGQWFVRQKGYKHTEMDHFEEVSDPAVANKLLWQQERCLQKAVAFLEQGHNVVISNIYATHKEISALFKTLPVDFNDIEVLVAVGGTKPSKPIKRSTMDKLKRKWTPWVNEKAVTLDYTTTMPKLIRVEMPEELVNRPKQPQEETKPKPCLKRKKALERFRANIKA